MLVKFETKSARVKGVSFHPKRPWVLASLHTGAIHLYDYQLNNRLDIYESHQGPVRGVSFHDHQPIFVSGGDDYLVKVWNYQQRRCLFTLTGHMDYVRSVFFHPKHPWILSSSDDQTIRIWNWQSRSRLALLTGHNHYVMCAQFHPTDNIVVSASLDQTLRVWDISGLVKRHTTTKSSSIDKTVKGKLNVDLFGEADFIVKYVLEGHDKGINWASFHPTLPLIVSGADDRNIKLWRIGEEKIWEVNTFRGHYNNVSAVLFHPRQPIIISASEDKSIRAWDMSANASLHIHRRNHDRVWITTAHPSKNLFCAGHDSGLMIFKLERERPVWAIYQNTMFYVKEKYLRISNWTTGQDTSIMRLRGGGRTAYSSISYNPAENSILLNNYDSAYELYGVPVHKDISLPPDSPRDFKRSSGKNACWVGRNRFAVIHNESHLLIKTTKNEVHKKIQLPFNCINIFPAGTGMLLIQQQPHQLNGDRGTTIILFDVHLKQIVTKVRTICTIKRVVWSNDKSRVALLGKTGIMLCNKKLEVYTSWIEISKLKSGAWRDPFSEIGVFVYNTSAHLKYAFINGDTGTIRTLDVPIYIVTVNNDQILCFDREVKPYRFKMDITEILFKLALITGNYSQVLEMIQSCKLVGQSIIRYIHQKGYPDITLHFLQKQDERTRFSLALECCNVDVALECARILDTTPVWNKLAETALLLGNHQTVELCYQRTKNVPKLSFLYLITGNKEKLKKLLKTSAVQGNPISWQYWMALVSGDVENQLKLLSDSSGGKTLVSYHDDKTAMNSSLLVSPPSPLFEQQENWPRLVVSKSIFGSVPSSSSSLFKPKSQHSFTESSVVGAWADNEDELTEALETVNPDFNVGDGGGWDNHEDIVPSASSTDFTKTEADDNSFAIATRGTSLLLEWTNTYHLPIVHILSGNFESTAKLLHKQIGVINIAPFRELFLNAYQKSYLFYTPLPSTPGRIFRPVLTVEKGKKKKQQIPPPQACEALCLNTLVDVRLKGCYDLVTKGQFMEATNAYRNLLLSIPLLMVKHKSEVLKAQELILLCKEYILGLQMEMHRKTFSNGTMQDQKRSLELAAYFTHLSMDHTHLKLALRTAMNLSYKLGYFKNAAAFAKRLLELGTSGDLVVQARKLLKASENKSDLPSVEIEYDEYNPFSVCAKTYKPIYRGKAEVKCPFCEAAYIPQCKGSLCQICTVAEVGKDAVGLQISAIQLR